MKLYKDIIAAPHTLIAGTTGSGKSNVLNGIIRQIMTDRTPQTARLYLIDPKRVELSVYKNTAFVDEYTADSLYALAILDKAIAEIERRYKVMELQGIRDFHGTDIYIIIDELADLMISPENKEIRRKLQKIEQIGRAAAVHVIAATQAPNRQIIPANIVLNFTNRLALRCLSGIESRQIINVAGAEELPRYGQGLYLSPDGIERVDIPKTDDFDDIVSKWQRVAPQRTTTRRIPRLEPKKAPKEYPESVPMKNKGLSPQVAMFIATAAIIYGFIGSALI